MEKNIFYNNNILSEVQIEITRKCNWHCDFCYLGEDRKKEMDFEIVKGLFKELKELGCIKINFTGGEPLVHKHAINIFREAKKMGFICKMNTNASLITEKNYEELADIFSEFFISIHSDDEKIHDELTQREGSLKNTITGIRLLKSKNARITINTVLTNLSIARFDNIKKFVEKDLKCEWNPETRIDNMLDGNTINADKHSLKEKELMIVLNKINAYRPEDKNTYPTGICFAGRHSCFIDAEGKVYPCLQFKNKQGFNAQNIVDNNIKDIWYHDEILNKIRSIEEKDFEKCFNCANYKRCYKCIANNYISTNKFTHPSDEICRREKFYADYSS